MATPNHLKPVEWSDLEAKDQGENGLMNVAGIYQTEQSIATALGMSGDRESPRYMLARSNMATVIEYLETVHHLGEDGLKDLIEKFTLVASQRSRSKHMRHHGVPAATCRND